MSETRPRKRTARTPGRFNPRKAVKISRVLGDSPEQEAKRIAAQVVSPELSAFRIVAAAENGTPLSEWIDTPGLIAEMRELAARVNAGDLSRAAGMLINQAVALENLSARLIERGLAQSGLPQFEAFVRLGLKAQAQSRLALEALVELAQGPPVFARQANFAHGGPMQVNNGSPRVRESEKTPNKLMEAALELDARETTQTVGSNPPLEALAALDGTKVSTR